MQFYIDHAQLTFDVEIPSHIESHPYFSNLTRIFASGHPKHVDVRLTIELEASTHLDPMEEFDPRGLEVTTDAGMNLMFRSEYLSGKLHAPPRGSGPRVGKFKTVPRMAFIMAAISLVVSAIVVEKNAVLVHSSAVDLGRGALVILGESGAGKTTAAQHLIDHLERAGEISFDSSIVSVDAGGKGDALVRVNTSLIDITRGVDASRRDVPVLAVVEIVGWEGNDLQRLGRIEGFNAIARNLMYWNPGAEGYRSIMALLETLVGCTPVYTLRFRRDGGFVRLIDSQIVQAGSLES